jgi:hypothetical protein
LRRWQRRCWRQGGDGEVSCSEGGDGGVAVAKAAEAVVAMASAVDAAVARVAVARTAAVSAAVARSAAGAAGWAGCNGDGGGGGGGGSEGGGGEDYCRQRGGSQRCRADRDRRQEHACVPRVALPRRAATSSSHGFSPQFAALSLEFRILGEILRHNHIFFVSVSTAREISSLAFANVYFLPVYAPNGGWAVSPSKRGTRSLP